MFQMSKRVYYAFARFNRKLDYARSWRAFVFSDIAALVARPELGRQRQTFLIHHSYWSI